MICFLSSKQDITVPMACLYLLRGGSFYEFHEFAMLFIKHLLDILMNANIMEVSLVKSMWLSTHPLHIIHDVQTHWNTYPFMTSPQFTKKLFPSNKSYKKTPHLMGFPLTKGSNP
jgi:hypothetical protein